VHLRVADTDPQRQPTGGLGHRVEPPNDERATAVGDDLDLQAVTKADAVDRNGRHEPTLCPRRTDF
jgi:hypothetical protein